VKRSKVLTVLGTRPEIIRLSRVMAKLDEHVEHCIVHTGQNYDYELNSIFFDDMGLRKPDVFLEAAGANAAATIGRIIERFDSVLAERNPDAVLVLGDTNSCLAAIPAKRRKIPVFHMEAGNRCFDERVPEETNRRIVDHISDINMPYSDIAREYLLREGIPADRVIKTGSPMFEVLTHYRPKIDRSDVLERLDLKPGEYFVVSCHREENVDNDKNFDGLAAILNQLATEFGQPIILSAHPRTRNKLESRGIRLDGLVRVMKPFGFTDYVRMELDARLVLSDSGTITEEASVLNFPALNIRESHERPEGMEECPVIMCGLDPDRAMEAAGLAMSQPRGEERRFRQVSDYAMPNVSDKVVRIILSYISYVNRVVWRKY
jgi:UDP-N-acetylglucosamine 2-epimerase (non-hydrolysing)